MSARANGQTNKQSRACACASEMTGAEQMTELDVQVSGPVLASRILEVLNHCALGRSGNNSCILLSEAARANLEDSFAVGINFRRLWYFPIWSLLAFRSHSHVKLLRGKERERGGGCTMHIGQENKN